MAKKLKVLVVDDVLLERVHSAGIIRKEGHEVIEAVDGKQGLEMAIEQQPDVIIMDIVMPVEDGFSAAKKLKMNPKTKHIPVIIVSSKPQESDKFRAKQLGAKGYLVKKVEPSDLIEMINGVV